MAERIRVPPVAALARIPLFRGVDPAAIDVARLGGLSNRSYRVESPLGVHVLRLAGVESVVDRRAEAENARAAAQAGVGPEVLYADPPSGVLLCRFIDGAETMSKARFRDPGAVARAARALRRLHRSGAAFAGRLDPFAALEGYLAQIERLGAAPPRGCVDAAAAARPIGGSLAATPPPDAPCHVDPFPENFLDTGERMLLVDYEYAAQGDAMWDLAYLAIEAALGAAREAALLGAYFDGPPPAPEAARVALYKPVCDLVSVTWAVLQVAHGKRTGDLLADADARIARCRDAMAAPAFHHHLELVAEA